MKTILILKLSLTPYLGHQDFVGIELPAFAFAQRSFIFLHKPLRFPTSKRFALVTVKLKCCVTVLKCTLVNMVMDFTVKSQVSFSLARVFLSDPGSVSFARPQPPSASRAPLLSETLASPLSHHCHPLLCHLPHLYPALN